ncbi:succinate dehydrogenase, cytochrome b556 subunit [Citreimonas salinaria]|uniref:Succinate dehydrogenase cytochrome b556 subunit n=1 Tax=Citreimonas salinaria TaxID=321339 RepID=A0A1H3NHB6_9RHOB|nr:succinate dehydrogenase, cytochrome b556 subunit [Citreimonas salinaria]SDY88164.1 succinate dehydrogenase subunit C [Citreimonas salinaria]
MIRPHRAHPLWLAFLLHRISGLGLALFLPAHFYVLSLALTRPASLDGFLHWTENPLLKVSEFGLVFLLAVHMFGGLRLLALEFLPWSPRQKTFAAAAAVASAFIASIFFISAVA